MCAWKKGSTEQDVKRPKDGGPTRQERHTPNLEGRMDVCWADKLETSFTKREYALRSEIMWFLRVM